MTDYKTLRHQVTDYMFRTTMNAAHHCAQKEEIDDKGQPRFVPGFSNDPIVRVYLNSAIRMTSPDSEERREAMLVLKSVTQKERAAGGREARAPVGKIYNCD
jgi:hypothetical protein